MATKKFNHEVDKALKECRAQMDLFDDKWRQLRSLTAEFTVLQSISPEAVGGGMKAKKKVGNRPQCLESMDQRYIQDNISRLKNELEVTHKKLYKFRNEMDRLAASPELKNSGRTVQMFLDVKKEIEVRSKKGKTFYLRGVSSDITDVNDFCNSSHTVSWMTKYMKSLEEQAEVMETKIDVLENEAISEERDMLIGMLDLHQLHINRLKMLLHAVDNRTISCKGYQYDDEEEGGFVAQALLDAAALANRNTDEDSQDDQADLLEDIRELLEPYIFDNDEWTHVVCEDIYDRLPLNFDDLPLDEAVEKEEEYEEPVKTSLKLSPTLKASTHPSASKIAPTPLTTGHAIATTSITKPTAKVDDHVDMKYSNYKTTVDPPLLPSTTPVQLQAYPTTTTPIKPVTTTPSTITAGVLNNSPIPSIWTSKVVAGARDRAKDIEPVTTSTSTTRKDVDAPHAKDPAPSLSSTNHYSKWHASPATVDERSPPAPARASPDVISTRRSELLRSHMDRCLQSDPWKSWLSTLFFEPTCTPADTMQTPPESHVNNYSDVRYNLQVFNPGFDHRRKQISATVPAVDRQDLPYVHELLKASQSKEENNSKEDENESNSTAPQSSAKGSYFGRSTCALDSDVMAVEDWQPPETFHVALRWQRLGLCSLDQAEIFKRPKLFESHMKGGFKDGEGLETVYLRLERGDMIQAVAVAANGWIFGRNRITGQGGWFPAIATTTVPPNYRKLYLDYASMKFRQKARGLGTNNHAFLAHMLPDAPRDMLIQKQDKQ